MPVWIAMLRGVNVGAHNRIKMEALRALFESLKLDSPRTYVQSGNVIFRAKGKDPAVLANSIKVAIKRSFGFAPEVVLRSTAEIRDVIAGSPFAGRRDVEPGKLLVVFLAGEPAAGAEAAIAGLKAYPEELHLKGRELYIYFPNGVGKSKLPWASTEKWLKTQGTARNWNSVLKMSQMAEEMET